ncbi:dehydratase [Modestobacter roseus]|uniref:Acyl dehydratase n=1 Tax=Modestobacter roseus TaxID=1181884 RepID=A0A562IV21_9ACTN|nr:dehydratase [Modestobacter roseus]MQA32850.1 dehydratase [Modestobacter roseus]TWH74700.1 acyl dehydratase [Modestobacter roseus]
MPAATVVTGVEETQALAGRTLGTSSWVEVTAERVDRFCAATGTPPPADRTVPGLLVLALTTVFMPELLESRGFALSVNYGCRSVRFPAAVPVGSRVRCTATVDAVDAVPGGVQLALTLVFEAEGHTEPACVASTLVRRYL